MSSESSNSACSGRPIMPMPKRRLRERLAPDVARAIEYPPALQTTTPLFAYPYSSRDEPVLFNPLPSFSSTRDVNPSRDVGVENSRAFITGEVSEAGISHHPRLTVAHRPTTDTAGLPIRTQQRTAGTRHVVPQAPPSTASSVDGYDSFENSNNKKKRKIPTAGESILNSSHALAESTALGVPSPPSTGDERFIESATTATTPYYQSGAAVMNGAGISGPGRGRYGRVRNGRSPLRVLSDPNSIWPGRSPKGKIPGDYPSSPPGEKVGIISSAIASAEKAQLSHGQENINLLQQRPQPAIRNTAPAPKQFTFTFDSHNPVSWPGSDPAHGGYPDYQHPPARGIPADHRDTYGHRSSHSTSLPPNGFSGAHHVTSPVSDGHGKMSLNGTPRKPKRRVDPLAEAARRRKQQTIEDNRRNPPTSEDMYICEFCEYESIFGEPPNALIRQYEIKDRKRRGEEAERRRLLEKAKMKSRKGKKPSKATAKNSAAAPDRASVSEVSTQHVPPPRHTEMQGEELEDDYYEDDIGEDDLPPLEEISRSHTHRSNVNVADDGGGRGIEASHAVPLSV